MAVTERGSLPLAFVPERYRPGQTAATTARKQWWQWKDSSIRLDRYGPPDAPSTLLVLHGGGGNGGLMAPYAVAAARSGFAAVCPDLPGYGRSRVPDRRSIRYRDWVDVAVELLRAEQSRGRPVVILGLSVGGMLAYEIVARLGAAALVATCFLDPRDAAVRKRISRFPWASGVTDRLLPRLSVADRVLVPMRLVANMSAIANDASVSRAIVNDPTAGGTRMPVGFLRSYLASVPTVEPRDFSRCPVILAHPAADPWTPIELSLPFFHRIQPSLRRFSLLENAGHLPLEQPGLDQLARILTDALHDAATPGSS